MQETSSILIYPANFHPFQGVERCVQKVCSGFSPLVLWSLVACGGADGDNDIIDGDTDSAEYETDDDSTEEVGEAFRFVVISDTHVRLPGNKDADHYDPEKNLDNLDEAVDTINAEYSDADFVAVTGDLAGCLFSEDPNDYGSGTDNPADTFRTKMENLVMPYYPVLGNHDYQKDYDDELEEGINTDDIEAIESVWKSVLGIDPYYSFVHKGVRMLFLNSNRGSARTNLCATCSVESFCTGSFDEDQIAWLEDELSQDEPIIIFMHHPPYTDNSEENLYALTPTFYVEEGDDFYTVTESAADKIMAVFVGHGHLFVRDTLHTTIPVYETSSIGDTNGNGQNIHVIDVDPAEETIFFDVVSEDAMYWDEL